MAVSAGRHDLVGVVVVPVVMAVRVLMREALVPVKSHGMALTRSSPTVPASFFGKT